MVKLLYFSKCWLIFRVVEKKGLVEVTVTVVDKFLEKNQNSFEIVSKKLYGQIPKMFIFEKNVGASCFLTDWNDLSFLVVSDCDTLYCRRMHHVLRLSPHVINLTRTKHSHRAKTQFFYQNNMIMIATLNSTRSISQKFVENEIYQKGSKIYLPRMLIIRGCIRSLDFKHHPTFINRDTMCLFSSFSFSGL